MRGKQRCGLGHFGSPGLIPAHAGKTRTRVRTRFGLRAHPRACGENANTHTPDGDTPGSSPRMRGTRLRRGEVACINGLIPAHAGKTRPLLPAHMESWAHPRACGENVREAPRDVDRAGSSPRMRGKLKTKIRGNPLRRLIPAHAGKTGASSPSSPSSSAHPRACGENRLAEWDEYISEGSSPRMRGKQVVADSQHLKGGLIPAHAGKTHLKLLAAP